MTPKVVHIPIPRTCEHVLLRHTEDCVCDQGNESRDVEINLNSLGRAPVSESEKGSLKT